jgi:hypothetical protein
VTNLIQVGRLKLHPLDLLLRMSPLAFIQCVAYAWWSGELDCVREYGATEMTPGRGTALLVNGLIAFGLNVVSFTANKKTSALTMTVAGRSCRPSGSLHVRCSCLFCLFLANVKQVLTIILAVLIFNLVRARAIVQLELSSDKSRRMVTNTDHHPHELAGDRIDAPRRRVVCPSRVAREEQTFGTSASADCCYRLVVGQ